MIPRLLLTFFVFAPCCAAASDQAKDWPADVAAFIEQRDLCDHFRGEEPYNEERRKFLAKNIVELCTGTDTMLAHLKEKYRRHAAVLERLSLYEHNIEPKD